MQLLTDDIIQFFARQGFVIVSTIDSGGMPHTSCKGIVKIEQDKIYLLDLYKAATYDNLKKNPKISLTAVDEHKFRGYCIKGRASILKASQIKSHIIKTWEDKITTRVRNRILKNIRGEKGHPKHPEILLPKPEYLIAVDVEKTVNLTPHALK
ncbi:MAG: pyridoxamine 5'-phosphate oxidase family protein [Candidatus Omnitrophica bacterium]|nr:pyridoxamine 5'-phosphate oxidase family protein [Candidatus Omnitrophota bacterium]